MFNSNNLSIREQEGIKDLGDLGDLENHNDKPMEITYGENRILLGLSQAEINPYIEKLKREQQISSLYQSSRSLLSRLSGCEIKNVSQSQLSRSQITKDLKREHIIVNNTPFDYEEDCYALKLFLLEKVNDLIHK